MASPTRPTADRSVRVGWADDAEAVAQVQVRAWRRGYAGLLPADILEAMDVVELASAWRRALGAPPDARNRLLVALERATVRGFAVTGPSPDPDTDAVHDGELSELTVDPDHQRHGHGSRLVHACVDTLRADGFTRALVWLTRADDARRELFTAAGFEPDGARRELDLHGDGAVRVHQERLHADVGGD